MAEASPSTSHQGKRYLRQLIKIISSDLGLPITFGNISLEFSYMAEYTGAEDFRSTVSIEGSARCLFETKRPPELVFLFVKLSPIKYCNPKNAHKEMMLNLFEKEMLAYEVVVPILCAHQTAKGKELFDARFLFKNLFPRCRGMMPSAKEFNDKPTEAMLALDYLNHPFVQIHPKKGMELETAKLVVEKLALFHAVALAFLTKQPEKYAILDAIVDRDVFRPTYTNKDVKSIMAKVKKIPELSEHKARIQAALTKSLEAVPEINEDWVSLCHGQMCLFNLMVEHGENDVVKDCRILDLRHLQNRHILSDLVFFLMTSLSENVLQNHFKELVAAYYQKFWDEIVKFRLPLEDYTIDIFQQQLELTFQRELLHCVQQLKFLAAKLKFRDELRTLSVWPPEKDDDLSSKVDNDLHKTLIKRCLLTLIETNGFETLRVLAAKADEDDSWTSESEEGSVASPAQV